MSHDDAMELLFLVIKILILGAVLGFVIARETNNECRMCGTHNEVEGYRIYFCKECFEKFNRERR